MTTRLLDYAALVAIVFACTFIVCAVPAPFLLWTAAGSLVLLVRFRLTGRRELAVIAMVMPVFVLLRAPLLALVTVGTPHTADALLQPLDFGIAERFSGWLLLHPVCLRILRIAYLDALPLWISLAMAFAENAIGLLKANIGAAIAAIPFYLICPAVGPVWIHTPDAPRNCMPSLHFTWVLLALWYAPKWMRVPGAAMVVLTALATVGLGEHYLVDLVAAVPFTAMVCCLAGRPRQAANSRSSSRGHFVGTGSEVSA